MKLWQKLTIDWPCAFGDWLWAMLVVAPAAFLDRLTWRRVIFLAVLFIATGTFAQIMSMDMAFLMAGDVAFYYEIAAAVFFIATCGHARQAAGAAMRVITAAMGGRVRAVPRFVARQRRNAAALLRRLPKSSDDEPAELYAFA